jgi:hypothetical protein
MTMSKRLTSVDLFELKDLAINNSSITDQDFTQFLKFAVEHLEGMENDTYREACFLIDTDAYTDDKIAIKVSKTLLKIAGCKPDIVYINY